MAGLDKKAVLLAAGFLLLNLSAAPAFSYPFNETKAVSADFSTDEISSATVEDGYFNVKPSSLKIEVVAEEDNDVSPVDFLKNMNLSLMKEVYKVSPVIILNQIVNIGEKVWNIIEKNRPVVEIETKYANAVPDGVRTWTMLTGWQKPRTVTYRFSAENGYGMKVVDVKYQVTYIYGGNFEGVGQYLTGVTAQPLSVDVAWGFKFSLSGDVPDSTVVNVGTSQFPVAAMQVNLKWTISTPFKYSHGRCIYYIKGDGQFEELGNPDSLIGMKRPRVLGFLKSGGSLLEINRALRSRNK